jgi:hypothetical protein
MKVPIDGNNYAIFDNFDTALSPQQIVRAK